MEVGSLPDFNYPLQAAQESAACLQQQQKEADTRQAALAEHETRLQELQRALTAQQADLQQRQQELQVGALWRPALEAGCCVQAVVAGYASSCSNTCCVLAVPSGGHTCHQGAPEGGLST